MDQWGFQGITILSEILGILLLRELLQDLENLNGVPSLGEVYMGITARFGKISMEFFHLGGLQGNHTVVSKVQVTNTRMDQ